VLLPYTDDVETVREAVAACDGILLTGGGDVNPDLYGEAMREACGRVNPLRDELEMAAFAAAVELGRPVLAICRGIQLMNVALGGTLYQDIPTELDTNIMHRQTEGRYEHSHYVTVVGGTPLDKLFGAERVQVNSFHHQAIRELGVGLAVMARADDGIIEAVYGTDSCYMRGYQWHPELLYDTDGFATPLFEDFIKAAGER
jgi:putative glutamine amidotransferase